MEAEEVMERLEQRFDGHRRFWNGHITGKYAQLTVPRHHRHPWSPWLSFSSEDHEDGTILTGRFAPHHSIWTTYMAAYGSLGTLALGLGFFGVAQWMAGEPPTMLWAVPVCLVLILCLYGFAFIGQGLTAREMAYMREFVKESFDPSETYWAERNYDPESERTTYSRADHLAEV
jgi:hypothetical protein